MRSVAETLPVVDWMAYRSKTSAPLGVVEIVLASQCGRGEAVEPFQRIGLPTDEVVTTSTLAP